MRQEVDPWAQYMRWNNALASLWFSSDQADLPVYLDVDEASLRAAAQAVGANGDPTDALAACVSATLWLPPTASAWKQHPTPFARHQEELLSWRRVLRQAHRRKALLDVAPPVVALLAAFSVAAARMGADTQFAPHAYFPRLFAYLNVGSTDRDVLTHAFRRYSEDFWHALNEYVGQFEGGRGIPTAYALGHRFVGIPQSQALVRAHDRSKLPGFFRAFGLPPGSEVVHSDLERLLDVWIGQDPTPVSKNLVRLWSGKGRERIAGVVAGELSHWDGGYSGTEVAAAEKAGDLSLTALVRRRLGQECLELSFAARFGAPVDADLLTVDSAEGQPTIAVMPLVGGRVRPAPGSRLDPESLLGARVEVTDEATAQTVQRLPRRIVPLHRDELLGLYVETERVLLAEAALVLVQDEPVLVHAVEALLRDNGHFEDIFGADERPGVKRLTGLPAGWLLFTEVRVLRAPTSSGRVELNVLTPLTSARLTFSGGLKLPGRVRKWSSLCPPEVLAVTADTAALLVLSLKQIDEESGATEHRWTGSGGMLAVALAELTLPDGDYELAFLSDDVVLAQSMLRLRSGSTPDLMNWETCTRLRYQLDTGDGGTISASAVTDESTLWVNGSSTVGGPEKPRLMVATATAPHWATNGGPSSTPNARAVVLGNADPESCMVTGKHYLHLPTWYGGKATGHIEGVCRTCSLVKRYPASAGKAKKVAAAAAPFVLDPSTLKAFTQPTVSNDVCMDALVHVGGGPIARFERVATQAEASGLFVDDFLRTLEILGFLDVRRDDRCQPVEWEVCPPQLAGLPNGDFLLTGAWTPEHRSGFAHDAAIAGGELSAAEATDKVKAWTLKGLGLDAISELARTYDVPIAPDAARRLLASLPPLLVLESSLKVIDVPSFSRAQRYDVDRSTWAPIPGVAGPGAYRLEQSFRTVYLWIDDEGARTRRGRIGSAQLVKHLAAHAQGLTLLAHLGRSGMLLVPLGADLPGLYGRAVALCSGRAPVASPRTRSLAYYNVPTDVADALTALLTT